MGHDRRVVRRSHAGVCRLLRSHASAEFAPAALRALRRDFVTLGQPSQLSPDLSPARREEPFAQHLPLAQRACFRKMSSQFARPSRSPQGSCLALCVCNECVTRSRTHLTEESSRHANSTECAGRTTSHRNACCRSFRGPEPRSGSDSQPAPRLVRRPSQFLHECTLQDPTPGVRPREFARRAKTPQRARLVRRNAPQ
jgi:hypothetical protein